MKIIMDENDKIRQVLLLSLQHRKYQENRLNPMFKTSDIEGIKRGRGQMTVYLKNTKIPLVYDTRALNTKEITAILTFVKKRGEI